MNDGLVWWRGSLRAMVTSFRVDGASDEELYLAKALGAARAMIETLCHATLAERRDGTIIGLLEPVGSRV